MPEKFVVPQFIDNEDKILGPITVRQFLIMLSAVFMIFIGYAIFTIYYFIAFAIFIAGTAATFSFVKINGQPFHIFFVNFLQTSLRPPLRVWNKNLSDSELRALSVETVEHVAPLTPRKPPPAGTRLRDLALTVNTGGVYNAEDDAS